MATLHGRRNTRRPRASRCARRRRGAHVGEWHATCIGARVNADRTFESMKRTLALVIAALAVAAPASAQTMYRCLDLGRTVYSDKPCLNGEEVRQIAPNGNPTQEQLERARMKARLDEQRAIIAARAKRDAETGKTTKCVKGSTVQGCEQ